MGCWGQAGTIDEAKEGQEGIIGTKVEVDQEANFRLSCSHDKDVLPWER